jgi:hypothetical protein
MYNQTLGHDSQKLWIYSVGFQNIDLQNVMKGVKEQFQHLLFYIYNYK